MKFKNCVKKIISFAFGLGLCISIAGCDNVNDNINDNDHTGKGKIVYHSEPLQEWISPDGVHYWFFEGVYTFAIVPRYDSSGNIITD